MKKKGSAMYFALVVLTIMLGIVLGLSTMLISQIRIVRGMEHSVIAFHAASTGIERALRILRYPPPGTIFPHTIISTEGGGVIYRAQIVMGGGSFTGDFSGTCARTHYCIKSIGFSREVRRSIEVGR